MVIGVYSPSIRYPGLETRQPDQELYTVPAMGSITINVQPDDRLTISTDYASQCCDVYAFNQQGRDALDSLSLKRTLDGGNLNELLHQNLSNRQQVVSGLKRRNVDIDNAQACRIFHHDVAAGHSKTLKCADNLFVIITAPGEAMSIEKQNAATDITVKLTRAAPVHENDIPLPEPLAEPRLDIRVNACTAQSYTVYKGEYIQTIDVAGRECSDFQAFSVKSIDEGLQDPINVTTTRTITGCNYPMPGLHAKYFDKLMVPLVEVVQDTVGRHDTFGIACAAKYYEDKGYFGHPNCSDNFNYALEKFGVEKRKGWDTINLFYNTGIDEHNVMYLDEPWSRPGDYVLFRALTDLVCVTSACPDDTSAANGWNPTDIHVRVYPKDAFFKNSIAFRSKPESEAKMTRETAFHPKTSELTRKFVEYKGFWLPSCYTDYGAENEYYAAREKVIATDLSPLRKFEVFGPDSEALMQWCATRNVKKIATGQVVYTAMCYEHGGMFDDGTILRLDQNNFRWIGGDEYGGDWLKEQAQIKNMKNVQIRPSTDQIHNIAVQGPNSRALLKQIIWTPPSQPTLEELGWFRFLVGRLHDDQGPMVMVSRTGYTGELGYEIFCHPSHGELVWDSVWEKGEALGIAPLGLDALDMLRIEAGLIFAGYEFDEETDPFEAGIGFTVPLKSKEDDFLGKDALIRRKASPQKVLVGLELHCQEVGAHGDCVHVGRPQIGTVTSAMRSPILNKNIALCRIDVTHSEIGTQVEVGKLDGHQKRIPATVVRFPFYDPDKSRVRA